MGVYNGVGRSVFCQQRAMAIGQYPDVSKRLRATPNSGEKFNDCSVLDVCGGTI